ncbi:MAG: RNA polymerase sigma factor [Patescibacteria group bacterium]
MMFSDENLIDQYLKGDERALEILIKRYLKPIFSFIFRFVRDSQEAEDITQEVFVKVWRNLKRFDKKRKFKTWIFTIAKNSCLDWLKKKKEITFSEIEEEKNSFVENIPDRCLLPNEIFEREDLVNLLNEALEKLSPKYKMVLLLRYNDHFTFKEIAETLEEPLNTIKSRHKRAIDKLKIFLKSKNKNK